jgi:small-conductance mechanosensitive channel
VATGLKLLVGVIVLLVIYRVGASAIHRFVPQVLRAQAAHLPSGSSSADEVDKRVVTIEDLLTRLLRVTVLALLVALVLVVFDLWSILAGIVIIIVALLFATQDVVLDYVMGFLILVEGPYFKGDS